MKNEEAHALDRSRSPGLSAKEPSLRKRLDGSGVGIGRAVFASAEERRTPLYDEFTRGFQCDSVSQL